MSDFVVEVRAVVVCFYRVALGVVGVGVEGVEVGAYPFYGREVLLLSDPKPSHQQE